MSDYLSLPEQRRLIRSLVDIVNTLANHSPVEVFAMYKTSDGNFRQLGSAATLAVVQEQLSDIANAVLANGPVPEDEDEATAVKRKIKEYVEGAGPLKKVHDQRPHLVKILHIIQGGKNRVDYTREQPEWWPDWFTWANVQNIKKPDSNGRYIIDLIRLAHRHYGVEHPDVLDCQDGDNLLQAEEPMDQDPTDGSMDVPGQLSVIDHAGEPAGETMDVPRQPEVIGHVQEPVALPMEGQPGEAHEAINQDGDGEESDDDNETEDSRTPIDVMTDVNSGRDGVSVRRNLRPTRSRQ